MAPKIWARGETKNEEVSNNFDVYRVYVCNE
jgi:hypothetical protein